MLNIFYYCCSVLYGLLECIVLFFFSPNLYIIVCVVLLIYKLRKLMGKYNFTTFSCWIINCKFCHRLAENMYIGTYVIVPMTCNLEWPQDHCKRGKEK